MSSVSIMDSVDRNGNKTLEYLRIEANLQKSDVYKGVGVSKNTYERWIEGRSIPDLSKAVALSKVLKAPLKVICGAFNIDYEGIEFDVVRKGPINGSLDSSDNADYDSLVRALRVLPDDEASAIIRLLINKKDGGRNPPSEMST